MATRVLARTDVRGVEGDLRTALARPRPEADDVAAVVREILAIVRAGGDNALRDLTERFDRFRPDEFAVSRAEREAALARVDPELARALEFARDQILAFHESQLTKEPAHERSGIQVQELVVPVDRAGCYVPGGRATYPSSVLMTAVPARVAGVPEVVLCVPASADGRVPDATLAAAALADVDELYRIGGAQAIAALAYGTDSIPPVDVIVGPGNAYVAEAKRQLVGVVGIDSLAGPSDVMIVADATSDPELVAADLLAQAEHGPGGGAIVVTWDEAVADAVDAALARQLAATIRREDATATLQSGGRAVLVDDRHRAIVAVNAVAPEHVQLMCEDADLLVPEVRNAGAVFVGRDASAVLGDYIAGVNHVLPTAGTARFASALRVADFQKHVHVVRVEPGALAEIAPHAIRIADTEGLTAHGDALRLRTDRS